MSKKYLVLSQNINIELEEISETVQRAKKAWALAFNFRIDKMKSLIENIDRVFNEVENSLQIFCKFLKSTE